MATSARLTTHDSPGPPGSRVVAKPPTVSRRHQCAALLVLLVILGSCCTSAGASRCKSDSCSQDFERSRYVGNVRQGPNARYCSLLRTYTDCLRATARSCRGDLSFHAVTRFVQQWTSYYNCTHLLETTKPASTSHKPHTDVVLDPTAGAKLLAKTATTTVVPRAECSYHGRSEMSHCGLFGDPHLVTFSGQLQTCKVAGAWPLIDNAYLAVSVTNEAVIPGSSATATTKVTVIIKASPSCTSEKTYEASVDAVPASFIDGTQWSGPASSSPVVRVVEKESGRHVEIHAGHLGAVLIVRQIGRYLTFAARLPREIAEQGASREGLQLCLKGCPASERIDTGKYSYRQSLNLCQGRNLTGFYLESCLFDTVMTNDPTFAEAAQLAQNDFRETHPNVSLNETLSFNQIAKSNANSPGRPLRLSVCLLLLSLCLKLLL